MLSGVLYTGDVAVQRLYKSLYNNDLWYSRRDESSSLRTGLIQIVEPSIYGSLELEHLRMLHRKE